MVSSRMQPDAEHVAPGLALRAPAVVVVAHPDDEVLWLSSVVGSADRIVFCFADPFAKPRKAAARRRAVAALPLKGVCELGLAESGTREYVDWAHPQLTSAGIKIIDSAASVRYEANYEELVKSLKRLLAGARSVFTHNPWGEYGHPEHIQVHRAVAAVQDELGYVMWFSNYVGKASWPLARALRGTPSWSERVRLSPDLAIARRLKRTYRRYGAWTWTLAHRWPAQETLYAQPHSSDAAPRHALAGETLLDVAGLKWWSLPRQAVCRLPP
jgi:LmbE family N-acetylglucosaminyl deacetylase